jgi:hypothetical protein
VMGLLIKLNNEYESMLPETIAASQQGHDMYIAAPGMREQSTALRLHRMAHRLVEDGHADARSALAALSMLDHKYITAAVDMVGTKYAKGRAMDLLGCVVDSGYKWSFTHEDLRQMLEDTDMPVAMVFSATRLKRGTLYVPQYSRESPYQLPSLLWKTG